MPLHLTPDGLVLELPPPVPLTWVGPQAQWDLDRSAAGAEELRRFLDPTSAWPRLRLVERDARGWWCYADELAVAPELPETGAQGPELPSGPR